MIECPHCGTHNDANSTRCQECGQTLNVRPEDVDAEGRGPEALPPIPDGGLAEQMPDWLRIPLGAVNTPNREPNESPTGDPSPASDVPAPVESVDDERIDPHTFLTEADFPDWIRQLATPPERRAPPPATPWDEPWTAAPAQREHPIKPPEPRPRPAIVVPQPAIPPSRTEPAGRIPTEPVAPLPPVHHDWSRFIGPLVVLLIVLAIGLVIILASTDSLP